MPSPLRINQLDLTAQYRQIADEVTAAFQRVAQSQHFILGPEVDQFEQEIADYCGTKYAVGMSSGSDALLATLMAYEIGPGDEIITTPFTFFATAGAIARVGAKPVFVDIDPVTYNLNPAAVEDAITPQTRAILPVHLYGQCADMNEINALADQHRLLVIEDAAQAVGAGYFGKRAGALGHAGCFSCFPSKNLGAFGDGGFVTTNDERLHQTLVSLRNHGGSGNYEHHAIGGNFRLDALQAAILRVKLPYLDSWNQQRADKAAYYAEGFAKVGLAGGLVDAPVTIHSPHVFHQMVIRTTQRDQLQQYLDQQGVVSRVYYPRPMHLQPCFASLGHKAGDFPEAERASRTTLALPIYPELPYDQIDRVIETMAKFFSIESKQSPSKAA